MTDGIAAVGVAPHSGWAAVVTLGISPEGPQVLLRSRIEMVDPRAPESKQPYHAVEGLDLGEAERRLNRYLSGAEDRAYAAFQAMAAELAARNWRMTAAGVLESAGRKGSSLAAILASHALIHAADGDHFREAIAAAAARSGLTVSRVQARELEARAEAALRRPLPRLRDAVNGFARQVGPPWGADQKSAALLAWLLLAPQAEAMSFEN
jgi:hypothetical protein